MTLNSAVATASQKPGRATADQLNMQKGTLMSDFQGEIKRKGFHRATTKNPLTAEEREAVMSLVATGEYDQFVVHRKFDLTVGDYGDHVGRMDGTYEFEKKA